MTFDFSFLFAEVNYYKFRSVSDPFVLNRQEGKQIYQKHTCTVFHVYIFSLELDIPRKKERKKDAKTNSHTVV